jgi:hypothetical protein
VLRRAFVHSLPKQKEEKDETDFKDDYRISRDTVCISVSGDDSARRSRRRILQL